MGAAVVGGRRDGQRLSANVDGDGGAAAEGCWLDKVEYGAAHLGTRLHCDGGVAGDLEGRGCAAVTAGGGCADLVGGNDDGRGTGAASGGDERLAAASGCDLHGAAGHRRNIAAAGLDEGDRAAAGRAGNLNGTGAGQSQAGGVTAGNAAIQIDTAFSIKISY